MIGTNTGIIRGAVRLLVGLCLLPLAAQAQFTFTTNSGAITITGYTGTKAAVIPGSTNGWPVTTIASEAFQSETNLPAVTIPASVTNIGSSAFSYCTNLGNLTIPGSVTTIGADAFGNCSGLTNVSLAQGLASIGVAAFTSCDRLPSVVIPASVTNFGSLAFGGQTLQSLFFKGNAPQVGNGFTMVLASGAVIYYLPGKTGWSQNFGGYATALWNPTIKSETVKTNHFEFTLTGTAGIPVVVETAATPQGTNWTTLQICSLTNGSLSIIDSQKVGVSNRFYRVRSP